MDVGSVPLEEDVVQSCRTVDRVGLIVRSTLFGWFGLLLSLKGKVTDYLVMEEGSVNTLNEVRAYETCEVKSSIYAEDHLLHPGHRDSRVPS